MTMVAATSADQALAELRDAQYRYTGDGLPLLVHVLMPMPAECLVCGSPRRVNLNYLRKGRSCKHRSVAPHVAVQWAAEAGWSPRQPYPGKRSLPWALACSTCSGRVSLSLNDLLTAGTACLCATYVAEMRAAGYEPEVPYPGAARKPWPSLCLTCGHQRTSSLSHVRAGLRCKHRGAQSRVRMTALSGDPG